jgi:ornithine carbamoyltransferase
MNFSIACPDGYLIPDAIWRQAERLAEASGATITRVSDPTEAARGADVLYTDVWTSMGQESERLERERAFAGYQINAELVSAARPGAVVMHDLPAHRGEEISNDTLERFADVIFTQAENRLHAQKAVMVMLMNPSTVQQALDAGRVPAR